MKSLSFNKLNISGADVLSRLQMKKVMGGHTTYCLINDPGQTPLQFPCTGGCDGYSSNSSTESCRESSTPWQGVVWAH